ncbi:MAG: ATP-binding protein [Roseateles sp.]|uniref:sensor histidine kinase n=1 Tax=Roseateles sp. TaxID=1971397 RepID=UPI0039EBCCFC
MNSLSDDSASSRRRRWRLPAAGLAGVALLALAALAWAWGAGPAPALLVLTAWLTALAVLAAAALGWQAGVRLTRQRLAGPLLEARQQLLLQAQLQRDWQWATDAAHRVVHWQAPSGAPAAPAPWERLDAEGELGQRLAARQPFADLPLAVPGSDARWRLRGLPRLDAHGDFAGYLGTAHRDDGAAAAGPAPAPPDLAAEHESFSYTVSHDLRAPLRVVEGFARILKEDYGARLDRVGNDHLDRVMSAAARMNSMIDALLSLSQLSTRPLASQPVDLSQLAGFVMEELRRGAPQRELALHLESGLTVRGDPTLLRMVLENLLGNAWKYSAKVARAEIRFGTVEQGGRRVFVVSDNGAGFDMRFAERLFGVFQRLHSASDFQGTGVGLALVRRIVRRHGGEIWADAAVGEGARFYFTLG